MIAETPRLLVRELTPDDAPFVLRLVNEPSFVTHIGDKGVRTLADAERFIRKGPWTRQPRPGLGQFAVELRATGRPVGVCGLLFRETLGVIDIGFAVLSRYRRRGYALEAAEAVMRYGHERLGIERIVALTAEDNLPSIAVLRALGLSFQRLVSPTGGEADTALYSE